MRFKLLSIVFLLSIFCMSVLGSPVSAKAPFPNGIGVCAHFKGAPAKDLDLIQQAGFDTIRTDFKWGEIESQKGVYNWTNADILVNGFLARNIRPYLILDYNNFNYGAATELTGISTDAQRIGYRNFAAAAVARYKGKGIIWELWNEPNLDQFWNPSINPTNYMTMVNTVVPAMRAADPDCYIVAPAVAFVASIFDFLKFCGANGLFGLVDAVSVHPYANASPESGNLDYLYTNVRTIIKQYNPGNPNLPIIGGEFGFSTVWSGMDETKQGNYIARQVLYHNSHNVPMSLLYDYINDGTSTTDPEANFGLLKQDYSVKPAYTLMQSLNTNLKGAVYDQKLTSAANDYYLQYIKGADKVIAMWTTGAAHSVTFNGTAINISERPIYVKITGTTPTPVPTPTPTPVPTPTPTPVPTPTPAIAAPSNLKIVSITKDAAAGIYYVNMSWTDNSNNETNFQVQQSINSTDAFKIVATPAVNQTGMSINIGTAPTQGTYYFKILAVNASGVSQPSNTANTNVATTPVVSTAPTNLTAQIGVSASTGTYSAILAWKDNAGNETGYDIYQSALDANNFKLVSSINALPGTASAGNTYTIGVNPTFGTYYYKVVAKFADGTVKTSNIANATVKEYLPPVPSSLSTVGTKDTTNKPVTVLTWKDNSLNEQGFNVYYAVSQSGPFTKIGTADKNAVSVVHLLTGAGTYYYKITSVNSAGESAASTIVPVVVN